MIKEWNLLRTIACLSVVFLHSTTHISFALGLPNAEYYNLARIMLCYATPAFIVLSEIILAYKYPNSLPANFFKRRIKWIVLPYIIAAIFYAVITKLNHPDRLLFREIYDNIVLGGFVGYFVLIILQFYILHYLVLKFNFPLKILLPASIIVMFLYLNLYNSGMPLFVENKELMKLPFTAWLGYFAVGFIIGKKYEKIAYFFKAKWWLVALFLVLSLLYVFFEYKTGMRAVYSKRFDLFPLTISICIAIIILGQSLPNYKIVNLISNYSFPIYLIHWYVLSILSPFISNRFQDTETSVILSFVSALVVSILVIKFISLLPYGTYVVGNINPTHKNETKNLVSRDNNLKKVNLVR